MRTMAFLRSVLLASSAAVTLALASPAGAASAQAAAGVTIAPTGTFNARTGIATLTGTVSCGENSGPGIVEVTLNQPVGRVSTVTGGGFADITCAPGEAETWTAEVVPTNGEYRGGFAQASARATIDSTVLGETGARVRLAG